MQMYDGLERFFESPLYGSASNKLSDMQIENFYFHHLAVWGFLGLAIYLFILFSIYFNIPQKPGRRIYSLLILSSFILCFSSPIFDQVRLFNIFYAFIAILIGSEKNTIYNR
jgi:asparagine N-glycosylation enzyme membrane subunit Stt3